MMRGSIADGSGALPWLVGLILCGLLSGQQPPAEQPPQEPVKQPAGSEAPGSGSGQDAPEQVPAGVSAPKVTPEGAAALRRAKEVVARAKGSRGADRDAILGEAVDAYRAVLSEFPDDLAARAQAHYALGELHRRLGSLAEAVSHYQQSAEIDPSRYAGRGWFGVGQMQRRLGDLPKAIAAYAKAAKVDPTGNRAADARVWIGRCHAKGGDRDAAITALQAALESAASPAQVIDAANWLAKELIAAGRLDAADQALQAADRAVADAAVSERDKARLNKKLAEMSARRALQRARDVDQDAAGDAQQVEAQPPQAQQADGRQDPSRRP